jgi:GAF domain-containing protein
MAVREGKEFIIPARKLNTDEVSFIIRYRQILSLGADYYGLDEMRRNLGITNGEGDIKSYMGLPLIVGDQVLGALAVRDTQRTRAFTLNDRRILTTIGSQLAAAIQERAPVRADSKLRRRPQPGG